MNVRRTVIAAFSAVLSLSAVVALVPTVAHAQDQAPAAAGRGRGQGRGGQMGGGMAVSNAFKAVKPTADQSAKFDALEKKMQDDVKAAQGAERMTIANKFRTDVEALLTDDQKKQFKEEVAVGTVMGRLRPLELTPEEVEKIKPAIKDIALQMDAVNTDTTMKRADKRTKMEGITTDLKAKIKPLLTADQQTKLDGLNFAGGGRRGGGAAPQQ